MGKDSGYLQEALVPGGSIEPRRLIAAGAEGLAALFESTIRIL